MYCDPDPDFCIEKQSAICASMGHPVVWRRPSDFGATCIFDGDTDPNDVNEGSLGDCYFIAALSTLASSSNLVKHLFLAANDGINSDMPYLVRFFCDGEWISVEIDDRIPCSPVNGLPLFGSNRNAVQAWVCLLEKAYAKLHGSYAALAGGNVSEALRDLTGAAVSDINLSQLEQSAAQALYAEVEQSLLKRELLCCAMTLAGSGHAVVNGIIPNHAFSVVCTMQLGKDLGIKLRNPWGTSAATAALGNKWAANSTKWTAELRRLAGESAPGTFWLSWVEFMSYFNRLYICRVLPSGAERRHSCLQSRWTDTSAGGCNAYSSWRRNPQFRISFE
jgi:hypothetical protein